jgi:hypothetical protein
VKSSRGSTFIPCLVCVGTKPEQGTRLGYNGPNRRYLLAQLTHVGLGGATRKGLRRWLWWQTLAAGGAYSLGTCALLTRLRRRFLFISM